MTDEQVSAFVTSLAFDGAGGRVVVAGVDGTVSVWDAATGLPVGGWACHAGPVNAVTVATDRELLFTAGHDGSASVWRLADGGLARRLGGLPCGALDAVPVGAGPGVAVAGYDGLIRVYGPAGAGADASVLAGHDEAVTTLWPLGPDELASGSRDGTVRVWDLAAGRATAVLRGHGYWVTRVRPACGGDLVSAGEDGILVRWPAGGGPALWRLDVVGGASIWGLACDAAGRRAVVGAGDQTWLVDLETATASRLTALDGGTYRGVAIAPDGRTAALGGDTGRVVLVDLDTATVRAELRPPGAAPLSLAAAAVDRAVIGRADGTVELVTAGGRTVVAAGHGTIAYSARRLDADRFATGGFDGTVRLWDLATGERSVLEHGGEAFSLSATAAGDRLVVAGGGRLACYDLAGGGSTAVGGDIHGFAAIDAAGTRIASAGESDRLTISSSGNDVAATWTLPDDYACAVEWVPDPAGGPERQVVVGTAYGRVHLVEAATGATRPLHAGHEDWIRQLRVTPDGRYVASASQNGAGRVYDLAADALVGDLAGRPLAAIDATPDGEIVGVDFAGRLRVVTPRAGAAR